MTNFQKSVYAILKTIPCGRVMTYKQLAEIIGCKSAQAIGQALKRNPDMPIVPCHRVVKSDLRFGGYCGKTSGKKVLKKIALLKEEGVEVVDGKVSESALFVGE